MLPVTSAVSSYTMFTDLNPDFWYSRHYFQQNQVKTLLWLRFISILRQDSIDLIQEYQM